MQVNNNTRNQYISWIYVKDNQETKYCPQNNMKTSTSHPRVALKFSHDNASCPYCGTQYKIKRE